jgi:hypothetical protein
MRMLLGEPGMRSKVRRHSVSLATGLTRYSCRLARRKHLLPHNETSNWMRMLLAEPSVL